MNAERRGFIATLITLFAVPSVLKADVIPVRPVESIPVRPATWGSTAKKALNWAAMCLRMGAHWSFEGIDWMVASLPFMRSHLRRVHGHRHEVDGWDRSELTLVHDAHHEGRNIKNFMIPATPANGVDKLNFSGSCPNGNCPIPQSPRRRGLFRLFGG